MQNSSYIENKIKTNLFSFMIFAIIMYVLSNQAALLYVDLDITKHEPLGHPKAWQYGFQLPGSPIARGIFSFHEDLMVFLVLILFFVMYVLAVCVYTFSSTKKNTTEHVVQASTLEIMWTLIPAFILNAKTFLFNLWTKFYNLIRIKDILKVFREAVAPIIERLLLKWKNSFLGQSLLSLLQYRHVRIFIYCTQLLIIVNLIMYLTKTYISMFADIFLFIHIILLILRTVCLIFSIIITSNSIYKYLLFEFLFWCKNIPIAQKSPEKRAELEILLAGLWGCYYFIFRLWASRIHILSFLLKFLFR